MATEKTNTLSYWLNWRFLLCAIWIFISMILAAVLIWKHEGSSKKSTSRRTEEENPQPKVGVLYEDEAWRTCLTQKIHPGWLLGLRVFGFLVLFGLITANVIVDGVGIFYFYTQWTFALVTLYFGIGSAFSIYGFCKKDNRVDRTVDHISCDKERGTYVAPTLEGNGDQNTSDAPKNLNSNEVFYDRKIASVMGYAFQVIFQMCAGAVVLTDIVFWAVLYPTLSSSDYRLNFLMVCMHSINLVFLLGDTFLNGMRFPMFRITYFILWTGVFVTFQWIIHACVSLWWPYPFLDLSSPFAPVWYFGVGLMHIPCYGIFALLIKLKYRLLSRIVLESCPIV